MFESHLTFSWIGAEQPQAVDCLWANIVTIHANWLPSLAWHKFKIALVHFATDLLKSRERFWRRLGRVSPIKLPSRGNVKCNYLYNIHDVVKKANNRTYWTCCSRKLWNWPFPRGWRCQLKRWAPGFRLRSKWCTIDGSWLPQKRSIWGRMCLNAKWSLNRVGIVADVPCRVLTRQWRSRNYDGHTTR